MEINRGNDYRSKIIEPRTTIILKKKSLVFLKIYISLSEKKHLKKYIRIYFLIYIYEYKFFYNK